jgi:3-oxoacyl-[acyl-carrier protein] reductase
MTESKNASDRGKTLAGRNAVVAGGAGALGRATALALRDRGARVAVLDRDRTALAAFAEEPDIVAFPCDLLDPAALDAAIADAWKRLGPLSILVNATGRIHSAPLINIASADARRLSLDALREVIDANLTAVFLATASLVDRMVATRTAGVVVSLSSVSAAGNAGQGAYSAAKAGVNALTAAWAKELGPMGIRFVAVAPGFIDTATTRAALDGPALKEWQRRTPLRRLGTEADVVAAVMFAIDNEHLTGKVIEVDGGVTL